MNLRRSVILLTLALAVCLCLSGRAVLPQTSPLDQDWTQWSSDVCLKILTASPWVANAQPQDSKNIRRAVLLSSLLVREAMLRQMQVRQKYDKMSAKKRQEFDEQTATCLTNPLYSQYIVLRVWERPPVKQTGDQKPGQLSISDRVDVSPTSRSIAHLSCGADSFPWQTEFSTTINMVDKDSASTPTPLHGNPDVDMRGNTVIPSPGQPVGPSAPNPNGSIRTWDFLYSRSLDGKSLFQRGDRTMVFNWGEKGGQFTFQLAGLIYKDKLDF